jgi:exodeoxyribonuclease VII large subunit
MESGQNSISLFELQSEVKKTLNSTFGTYLWVHAEISEINVNASGHCYLELVEKEGDKIVAKLRATIWNFTFRILKPYFESSTGYSLSSGIKVSLKVSLEFHEIYGLSLNVKDVDPSYTVGDIELQKQKIIRRLEEEGVIDMNAELELPMVVQNIAVISSPTAAGWGDWLDQIEHNKFSYHFNHQLFEAQMQGEQTSRSIISALEKIYEKEEGFDAVVIIRGGGSRSDLSSFDTYDLAVNLAQFPLPIITGIGHERDESIVDMVAHTALKTPTAVADFLIDKMQAFENAIDDFANDISFFAKDQLRQQNQNILLIQKDTVSIAKSMMGQQNQFLDYSSQQIKQVGLYYINASGQKLDQVSEKIKTEAKQIFLEAENSLSVLKENVKTHLENRFEKEHSKVA